MLAWLGYLCGSFVILVILWIAFHTWRSYTRFKHSAEKQWRDRVLALVDAIARRVGEERAAMQRLGVADEEIDNTVRRVVLEKFLETVPVSELENHSGIGPATVARLRKAGYTNLARLHDDPLDDLALGTKRLADVRKAVVEQVQEVRSRFDMAGTTEAHALAVHLEMTRASRTEEGFGAAQRFLAGMKLMEDLGPRVEQALQIDFRSFMRRELDPETLSRIMRQRLPDLDETIRATDEATPRNYRLFQQGIDVDAVPEPPRLDRNKNRQRGAKRTRPEVAEHPVDLFRHALQSAAPAEKVATPAAPPEEVEVPEEKSLARLRLTVQFAFAVARADGRATHKEKQVIDQRLRRLSDQDRGQFNRVQEFAAHYETATIDLDECLHAIISLFTIEERRELLNWAGKISDASGKRNKQRKEFLDRVARKLGLTVAQPKTNPSILPFPTVTVSAAPSTVPTVPAPPPPPPALSLQQRRAALEIDPATPLTADLVRRQYNLLSERYAPEKFDSAGPDFVALAKSKREAVHEAATALLEQLGEKLATPAPAEPPALRHNPDLDALFGD